MIKKYIFDEPCWPAHDIVMRKKNTLMFRISVKRSYWVLLKCVWLIFSEDNHFYEHKCLLLWSKQLWFNSMPECKDLYNDPRESISVYAMLIEMAQNATIPMLWQDKQKKTK